MGATGKDDLKWFAARAIRERGYVLKYLELQGLEISRINDLPTLIFIHCSQRRIESIRWELYDKVLFYRDPLRRYVEPVPECTMRSFLILAPFHDKPVIYLPVDDVSLFEGPKVRVTSGMFTGCEGTLRRIKGEKRLIIRLSDHAAVATPHIPKGMLEEIP